MGAPTCSDTSGEQVCPGFLLPLLGETTPDVTVEFPRRRRLRRPVRHSWICRPIIIQTLTPTTHRRCRSGLGNRSNVEIDWKYKVPPQNHKYKLSEYLMTHFIQSVHALVTPFRQGQFSEHQLFRIEWLHCFLMKGVGVEIFIPDHCPH